MNPFSNKSFLVDCELADIFCFCLRFDRNDSSKSSIRCIGPGLSLSVLNTSEVRDIVVLLQHGQGGGVQVKRQAYTASYWCGRVLDKTYTITITHTTPFRPRSTATRKGRWFPGTGGRVLIFTHLGWRQRKRTGIMGMAAVSTTKVQLWP